MTLETINKVNGSDVAEQFDLQLRLLYFQHFSLALLFFIQFFCIELNDKKNTSPLFH